MIYVTGDLHGDMNRLRMIEKTLAEGDYLIVCGDFGFIYYDNEDEERTLDEIKSRGYTVCFIDGNHENFAKLNQYPREMWHGGRIHRIRKNVVHLMRGQVYEIGGSTFYTMGGAYSIDRAIRVKDVSYWEEELPSNADYRESGQNLRAAGMQVDYVLTHTAPQSVIRELGMKCRTGYAPDAHDAELTGHLEWIAIDVQYRQWFFGHWHEDAEILGKFRAVYFDVICIGK